ncbi:hypothetical protein [Pseudomonas sp. PONIH3]|nr:hypothetical protein [Pseudomonas sp. PONIH3]AUY33345.1 hypothetical protein C3F42_09030 [Pseudomonas sp. PONIH3]
MPKPKKRQRENPGFESTILIDPKDIIESASAFGDVAISLSHQLNPYGDPRLNVVFTNGAFALELYFKSQLVERIFEPAFIEMTAEGESVITEEQYLSGAPNVAVFHHSRLEVKEGFKSHKLSILYQHLSEDTRARILTAVSTETSKIQTQKDMQEFLETINDFFVNKRYHFEEFITDIESDKKYIYTLVPVLNGVKSALADT